MRKLSEIEAQALAYIAPAPHTLDSDRRELVSALREAMALLDDAVPLEYCYDEWNRRHDALRERLGL